MAVWITGSGGFIGRHLARRLAGREKSPVVGLGRGMEEVVPGLSAAVHGTLERDLLERAAALHGPPSCVYHLAGGSSVTASVLDPGEDRLKTLPGLAVLLSWLRDRSPEATLVLSSSAAVYGTGHVGSIVEGAETRPVSPYAVHKLECEALLASAGREWNLRSAIVRLFSVYGPGLKRQLLWDLCRRIEARQSPLTLSGSGEERRDFLHVTDAAALLELAAGAAHSSAPVWNGGTGKGRTVRSIVGDMLRTWDSDIPVAFNGEAREGDPASMVADVTRVLGFEPRVAWEPGLALVVKWFREGRP